MTAVGHQPKFKAFRGDVRFSPESGHETELRRVCEVPGTEILMQSACHGILGNANEKPIRTESSTDGRYRRS
jgi:hypothetical protein